MLRQREDRVFLLWSLIWMIWTMSFIVLAGFGFTYAATGFAVVSFVPIWCKFCNALAVDHQQKQH